MSFAQHRERLYYMDLYRGFTILCIVLVHSLSRFLDHSLSCYDYLAQLLGESTCIFCLISGFFYDYIGYDNQPYSQFIRKKVQRLIVPYLFWSIPFLLWESVFKFGTFEKKWIVWAMASGLKGFNPAHWYIQLIFVLFCIAPLFKKLFKVLYLGEIITAIALFLSIITGRDEPVKFYYGIATIPHMVGFFLLGMLISKHEDLLRWKGVLVLVVVGFVLCGIQGYFKFPEPKTTLIAIASIPKGITLNWLTLNKLFLSIGLMAIFYRISQTRPHINVLNLLAKYSFPIYFCHLYFYLPWLLTGKESHGNFIHFVIYSCYMLVGSLLLCLLLSKVKIVNKLIGI